MLKALRTVTAGTSPDAVEGSGVGPATDREAVVARLAKVKAALELLGEKVSADGAPLDALADFKRTIEGRGSERVGVS